MCLFLINFVSSLLFRSPSLCSAFPHKSQTIEPLRQQIQDLDAKILDLRKTLNPPTSESPAKPLKINDYPDLTMEKAEKLMKARNATFSYLEKQLASTSMSKSTSTSTSNPNHAV